MVYGRLLDYLVQQEIDPFDRPTQKTINPPWNQIEVDRMTRCGDMADFSFLTVFFSCTAT